MFLLLLTLAWTAEPSVAPAPPESPATEAASSVEEAPKTHFIALPNLSYDTDDGLGFGARFEITRVKPGVDPYLASYVLHFYGSLEGYHHHRFRFDLPHLPHQLRLTGYLAFRAWLHNGFWGLGNDSVREPATDTNYSLLQPYLRLSLSHRVSGPWSLFGALQATWSRVSSDPNSVLQQVDPYGMDGGVSVQGTIGARWDTRLPEVTPEKGGMVELALRGAAPGGSGTFLGFFASARGFWTLLPRLTLALRGMSEYLYGDVPFYEMNQWGGWIPVSGMGGSDSLRGIPFGRFLGPGKWVANSELRIDVLQHSVFKRPLRWQFVPFADVGGVFGGDSTYETPLHPGVGGGIRAIFDTTMVVRIDTACGWDLLRESGNVRPAPNLGFYVVFDHMF